VEKQAYTSSIEDENKNLRDENEKLRKDLVLYTSRVKVYEEQIALLTDKLFGKKSEKAKYIEQGPGLFNEAEYINTAEKEEQEEVQTITYTRQKRKAGRKPLPESLPRNKVYCRCEGEELLCPCCGKPMEQMPEENADATEKLVYIPAHMEVRQEVHLKYACRNPECRGKPGTFKEAKGPASIIPGGIATPELLAAVLTSKYVDGVPYYRQEKQFERLGVELSRQDMSNWQIKVGAALKPLDGLLVKAAKEGLIQRHDETRAQVLNEEGRKNTSLSWIWMCRAGPPEHPVIRYKYTISRASDNIAEYTDGWHGYLQSDGYDGYDCALKAKAGIIHVGCMAHVRRRFVDAEKGAAEKSQEKKSAAVALAYIKNLYAIEGNLRIQMEEHKISGTQFLIERAKESVPVLKRFKKWLDNHIKVVVAKESSERTLLEKAIYYGWNQWDKLENYLSSIYLTPDNNISENAIRPFVIGRKNWLFFNCPEGADSGCLIYSLIETAKANSLNPFEYLCFIIQQAPSTTDWVALLPWNVKRPLGRN
jgi:transposase